MPALHVCLEFYPQFIITFWTGMHYPDTDDAVDELAVEDDMR
jgi:hypothetical protein